MPRYIDADAYIENNECCGYLDEISVEMFNKITPTVDVVEVVRCKDCKYCDSFPNKSDTTMPLKCLDIRYGGVCPDWFCEHGERRKDNA